MARGARRALSAAVATLMAAGAAGLSPAHAARAATCRPARSRASTWHRHDARGCDRHRLKKEEDDP